MSPKRGLSPQVCLLAKPGVAVRPSRDVIPPHWDATCSVMIRYLHLSNVTARLICIYGVQCRALQSRQKNMKNISIWQFVLHPLGKYMTLEKGSDSLHDVEGVTTCHSKGQIAWMFVGCENGLHALIFPAPHRNQRRFTSKPPKSEDVFFRFHISGIIINYPFWGEWNTTNVR